MPAAEDELQRSTDEVRVAEADALDAANQTSKGIADSTSATTEMVKTISNTARGNVFDRVRQASGKLKGIAATASHAVQNEPIRSFLITTVVGAAAGYHAGVLTPKRV